MIKTAISTEILSNRYGYERAMEMISEAGFDAFDLDMFRLFDNSELSGDDYKDVACGLRRKAEALGKPFVQSHAPFPSYTEGHGFDRIVRAIEISGICGIPNIVIHPITASGNTLEGNLAVNVPFYNSLLPYAKKANVRIMLENMYLGGKNPDPSKIVVPAACGTVEEFVAHLDALDPEWFGICLDIGHVTICGADEAETVCALGGRIKALHVHDNDGVHDLHTAMFTQKIDFIRIAEALHEIGYKGAFTLESSDFLPHAPSELYGVQLEYMAKTARFVADLVENGTENLCK